MKTQIKRWGNSAAVRIPSGVLNEANLSPDSPVDIQVDGNRIIIEPLAEPDQRMYLPFSEDELISSMDEHIAHADDLAIPSDNELGE